MAIKGTVIKAGFLKLLCQHMTFKCKRCTGTQCIKQVDGNFTLPTKCPSKGCQNRTSFIPQYYSENTRTINCQTIKLQELIGNDQVSDVISFCNLGNI